MRKETKLDAERYERIDPEEGEEHDEATRERERSRDREIERERKE